MSLTLVTGPANAEKAGFVLGRVRAAAAAGRDPILVVPTAADVDTFRRELAGDGVALGVSVERFKGLLRLLGLAGGVVAEPLSDVGAERAARAAVSAALERGALTTLAASALTSGFPGAFARLCAELGAQGVTPQRLSAALAAWAEAEPGREAYGADLATLYRAYDAVLAQIEQRDAARHSRAICDALRLDPMRWGGRPVLLYGFDDLTVEQCDAIETLAGIAGGEVVVSLPFEPGRVAFAGRQETVGQLTQIAGAANVVVLDAPTPQTPIDALERALFDPAAAPVDPGAAIELLEGGGERAELELVAERITRLRAGGMALQEIAIAVRDEHESAALIEEVFAEAAIPIALTRRQPIADTGVGRGLLALIRVAVLGGGADDLLQWLRSPGIVTATWRIEAVERDVRRAGIRDAAGATASWEQRGGFALDVLSELQAAQQRGVPSLCRALAAQVRRLLHAPWRTDGRGAGKPLPAARVLEARAAAVLLRLLDELGALAARSPALAPTPRELYEHLLSAELRISAAERTGVVTVATPLALRARRMRALFLIRMREGLFPRPGRADAFLGDNERAEIAAASGLVLRARETTLDAERYLLYAAASRPTELLVLSWHTANDDAEAQVRSPFVDDVLDCLSPRPAITARRLGAIGWDDAAALSTHQRELSRAAHMGTAMAVPRADRLTDAAVCAAIAGREALSATEIEAYAQCPVKWFIERVLRPVSLDPDAEPLGRGSVAHKALEQTLRQLGEPLHPANAAHAVTLMRVALKGAEAGRPLSVNPRKRVAEYHRLESDLVRYLHGAAAAGSSLRPRSFELSFGLPGAEQPAVEVVAGVRLRGKIDRVDVSADGSQALVIDYKGRGLQPGQDKWLEQDKLQAGLYAIALGALEPGLDVAGAVLQPLGADPDKAGPRGFLLATADAGRTDVKDADRVSGEERGELLDAIAARAGEIAGAMRAGRIEARPESCSWNDSGCAYPGICRCAR